MKYYPLSNKYIKNKYLNILTSNNQQYRMEIKQYLNRFDNKSLLLEILVNTIQSSFYRMLIHDFYKKTHISILYFNDTFFNTP